MTERRVSARLPDFPWDSLAALGAVARGHSDGIIDLSVGTPVDPTPPVVAEALAAASNSPGYPTTAGTHELREAATSWLSRRFAAGSLSPDAVLPLVGSKEFIAALPLHLGIGRGDVVIRPELAYPTYEVGAALVGARVVATDATTTLGPETAALMWLNSPSNPTGRVLGVDHLRKVVQWCRERGTTLVSDECYLECSWEGQKPVSVLDDRVCDGDLTGILAVHSLSKRSNLAGYRCGFVAGDHTLISELLAVRKNLGLMMPGPQQAAMTVALDDDEHVAEQHGRYLERRRVLKAALEGAGFRIDHSEASLYLWATRGEDCWDTVRWLAERGILVAPGSFYGRTGQQHVRVAFTATDERVSAVPRRLNGD